MAKAAGITDLSFTVEAWVPGANSRQSGDPDWFRTLRLSVASLGLDEWELLLEVNVLTDPMGQALVDALNTIRTTGFVRDGQDVPPADQFDLSDIVAALESSALQSYHRETLRALKQRLRAIDSTGLFAAQGTTITELLSEGRLSVILLERLAQSYRSAVVGLLTRSLIDDRARTAFAEKRLALDPTVSDEDRSMLQAIVAGGTPRTVVALDEAQSFLAPGVTGPARTLFVRLVKEGRNIGLSAVLATQQPSAVDQRILSQVETFIAHQLVTEADIRAVRDNLKSPLADAYTLANVTHDGSGLFRQLPPGQCLVSAADVSTIPRRSILVSVRARATVHGGIEL
jgi:DNA helicase HerA-like ATPase